MEKLHFSTVINAPKQKVWEIMLGDATYRQWTSAFGASGYYEGKWETGSDIRFLSREEDGSVSGMIGKIKEARPYDFVSIQYSGEIMKGQERAYTAEEQGAGLFENYTLIEKDGGTEILVDLGILDQYKGMFDDLWPKALANLKQLVEQG